MIFLLALIPALAQAAPARTLVQCSNLAVMYTGETPHFHAGNPAKNTESKREMWAVVDGNYSNAGSLFFRDEKGKRYDVKIHREMAFQYNRYIIEEDVIEIPGYNPLGELSTGVVIGISHNPVEGNSADILGLGDEFDTMCKALALP